MSRRDKLVIDKFIDLDLNSIRTEIDSLVLQEYNNPFERKHFLENKSVIYSGNKLLNTQAVFHDLLSDTTCKWVSKLLDVPIACSEFEQYAGLFVYGPGDYLRPHVDAGIHPQLGLRKVATALWYLTNATLEFWTGDRCTEEYPAVWQAYPQHIPANSLVLLANDDWAWHGVPILSDNATERIVFTVSYLAPEGFTYRSRFTNNRTRAYFAHEYGKPDEYKELRDRRADENTYQDVYRMSRS